MLSYCLIGISSFKKTISSKVWNNLNFFSRPKEWLSTTICPEGTLFWFYLKSVLTLCHNEILWRMLPGTYCQYGIRFKNCFWRLKKTFCLISVTVQLYLLWTSHSLSVMDLADLSFSTYHLSWQVRPDTRSIYNKRPSSNSFPF